MRYLLIILALFINLSLSAKPSRSSKSTNTAPSNESVGLDLDHLKYADEAIEEAIYNGYIPGAVLAVVRGGYTPYIKSYGYKSLYPTVEPMSDDTVFDIASCTKPVVTAIATMMMLERGKIALWDSVDRYIPDFNKNKKVDSLPRTIRMSHLLTHTSGLDPYVMVETLKSEYDTVTRDSLVDHIVKSTIRYIPGDKFRYSCLNFILLQHIIEDLTDESLREFAKREIFEPLNMTNTDYIPLDSSGQPLKSRRSKGFDMEDIAPTEIMNDSTVIRGVVHDPLAREVNMGVSGNSGLFSTAEDLTILMSTLLNNGIYDEDKRLLKPLTMKAMRSVPDAFSSNGRALGWDVYSTYASNQGDLLDFNTFGHTGFTGTSIVLDMENNIAIILLTNAIHADDHRATETIHLRAAISNIVAASIME